MTEIASPQWLDGEETTALEARCDSSVRYVPADAAHAYSVRSGVRPAPYGTNALKLSAATGMNTSLSAGSATIQGSSTNGVYEVCSRQAETLTITTAHPSLPRIDLCVIRVVDNGDATSYASVEIIAGTPAASPAVPTTPTAALALANISVAAGATSIVSGNITDVRTFTASSGGVIQVASSAAYPTVAPNGQLVFDEALGQYLGYKSNVPNRLPGAIVCTSSTRPASPVEGQIIKETDTGLQYLRASSAWKTMNPSPLATGWTNDGVVLYGAGSYPAIGNGSTGLRYCIFEDMLFYSWYIYFGSTSTYGSGAYSLILDNDFTADTGFTPHHLFTQAECTYYDSSAAKYYHGRLAYTDLGSGYAACDSLLPLYTSGSYVAGDAMVQLSPTVPFTWASGDKMFGQGIMFGVRS